MTAPVESETNVHGNFDLTELSIEWDNGDVTYVAQAMIDNGEFNTPEEDFDVGRFVWGTVKEDGINKAVLCGIS